MNHCCECPCFPPPPPLLTLGICNRALFSIIQSNESKHRDGCSLAHEILAVAVSSYCLMDLLLNATRRSVNLLPSLFVLRFLSRAIVISRWRWAWRWERSKMSGFPPLFSTYNSKCNSQRKTHQVAQIRHCEPAADRNGNTKQYTTTEVGALR